MSTLRVIAARIEVVPLTPDERLGFVLYITDEMGRIGLGEAAPLPRFSLEDAGACERALRATPFALGPFAPAAGELPAAAVRRALAPLGPRLEGVPAARFAIETALLDLLGQRLGQPISVCLGGPRPYDNVPVNGLLSADVGPEALARGARALLARGLRCAKVKLRSRGEAAFEAELAALIAMRRAVAPSGTLELRLDANGAWTEEQARRHLQALAPLAPRFVEQPVAPDRLHLLGPCALPWAADESLGVPGMPERLLEAPGCAAFVLKPAALGLLRAHELGARAQARGLEVVVTHLFDGPIGLAAACELALALPRQPLACGLDAHAGLAAWPDVQVSQRRRDGLITAGGHAGLGIAPWTA